jgi:hypothetical protein
MQGPLVLQTCDTAHSAGIIGLTGRFSPCSSENLAVRLLER